MKNIFKLLLLNKITFVLWFVLCSGQSFSQTIKIDSLKKVILVANSDTDFVNTAINLSWEYCYAGENDSAVKYSHTVLLKAKNEKSKLKKWFGIKSVEAHRIIGITKMMQGDFNNAYLEFKSAILIATKNEDKNGMAKSLFSIGNICFYRSEIDSAKIYYDSSIQIGKLIHNDKHVSDVLITLGAVYFNQGNFPKSLHSFYEALKIKEKINDVNGESACYNNIASVFITQKNYDKAVEMYKKSLTISEKTKDMQGIANTYSNLGSVYQKKQEYESALNYFLKARSLYEKMGYQLGYSTSLQNIGLAYDNLNKKEESIKYLLQAIEIKIKINDKAGLAQCYSNLGATYNSLKKYKEAKIVLYESKKISEELGEFDKLRDVYFNLSFYEERTGNFKLSLLYFQKYLMYRDSIDAEENIKNSIQTSLQYEFEKKATADSIKVAEEKKVTAAQLKQEKTQRYALYGGVVLITVFAGFMFNRFKISQKQNVLIQEQKLVVEEQKNLIEERHKEITDSINYAERIQRSLLADKKILDKNLKDYFIFYKPKDIVSGDFYWSASIPLYKEGEGGVLFCLATADSTGHGVPGAIMSLLNIACLSEAIKEGYKKPNEILNRTREEIITVLKRDGSAEGGKDGMDCSLCLYDFKNMKLFIAAANNPVWIVRTGDRRKEIGNRDQEIGNKYIDTYSLIPNHCIEIKPDKMPVGKHDKDQIPFTEHEVQLQKGDVVYTLTDGFPDQFGGEKGKKFMSKNLRELLVSIAHKPMHEQKDLLEKTFVDWKKDLEQVDDVTIIGVRI